MRGIILLQFFVLLRLYCLYSRRRKQQSAERISNLSRIDLSSFLLSMENKKMRRIDEPATINFLVSATVISLFFSAWR